jgi:hypothetical protein
MLLIANLGNDIRFVYTMNLPNCNIKSKMLFPIKRKCLLTQNSKALGSKKVTSTNQPIKNSQSYWLREKTVNHINHQYTFLEYCQVVNVNTFREFGIIRLTLKVDSLKFKSKMQEQSLSGKSHCPIIERDNVNSNQCTL